VNAKLGQQKVVLSLILECISEKRG